MTNFPSHEEKELTHDRLFLNQSLFQENFPPTAVLFDWDNTLVDTWKMIFYAMNQTLIAFNLEAWNEEFAISHIQYSGREVFPKIFKENSLEAQKIFYQTIENNDLKGLIPMKEAEELLKVLTEKKIPLGIVSNKRSDLLHKEVSHLKWNGYFNIIVGAGDAPYDKPSPEPILFALSHLKIPASSKVWMIGDAPVDWDCATSAGCQAIAIGNRFTPPTTILASIENCHDLKKIFLET